jgi:hypothetical protein
VPLKARKAGYLCEESVGRAEKEEKLTTKAQRIKKCRKFEKNLAKTIVLVLKYQSKLRSEGRQKLSYILVLLPL